MSGAANDDGFQRVLTASERRILRKSASSAAVKSMTLSECNSLENSVVSRLKKLGIDTKKELHELTVKVDPKELIGIIEELDAAISAVGNGVAKPDQHLSVAELDSKIKATKANLSQLKSKTKGAALSKEELDKASHETEMYISYLQEQIGITREFLKVKTSQASLLKLKNICRHLLSIKPKPEAHVQKEHSPSPAATTVKFSKYSKRDPTYIHGILKPIKDAKKENLDVSDLVSEDVSITIDTKRFQHPFNYILRIRGMFDTFIDRSEVLKGAPTIFTVYGLPADVKECIKYLQSLDMGPQAKLAIPFSKYKQMPNIEEKFGVLSFHYAGELDVLGTKENVKAAFAFVNEFLGKGAQTPEAVADASGDGEEKSVVYDYLVSRALSSKFRPLVRNIEMETGVSVHFEVNSKTMTGKATFQPKSHKSPDSVDSCVKAVSLLVSEFGHKEIFNASQEAVAFITDSEVQRKRYKSPNTCILKQGDKAFVVGFKKNLGLGYSRAVALAESRTTEPHTFKIEASQVSIVNPYLGFIESEVGSHLVVHSAKRDEDARVEIFGNAAQQKETVAKLKGILDNYVSVDRTLTPVEHTVLSEDRSKLEELETTFRVKLTLGKQAIKITGDKPNVKTIQDHLDVTFDKIFDIGLNGPVDQDGDGKKYGHLKVESKFLGKIIGKNGSTMRDIVARSGLDTILVCRDAEGDSFLLVGSKSAMSTAVDIIKHIIESDADVIDVSKMDLNRSIEEEYTSKHSFIRRTASVKPKQEKKVQEVLGNIDDTNDFPAL